MVLPEYIGSRPAGDPAVVKPEVENVESCGVVGLGELPLVAVAISIGGDKTAAGHGHAKGVVVVVAQHPGFAIFVLIYGNAYIAKMVS